MAGNVHADSLIVLRQRDIAPGPTKFGRNLLVVPSGRTMTEGLTAAGYPPAKIVDGANIVHDSDAYSIEVHQRPSAAP
jgi:hypothetical protein